MVKNFYKQIVIFTAPLILLMWILVLLPATPRDATSLLMSAQKKDSLLAHVEGPRMIFLGGSNLSFGMDSERLHQQTGMHPVNTAINADIGLQFMMASVLPFVREGDLVLIIPEYQHFYWDLNRSSSNLLRSVFDVDNRKVRFLSVEQAVRLIPHFPRYSLSKLNPLDYLTSLESTIYTVDSFNKYGDAVGHRKLEPLPFAPYTAMNGELQPAVIKELERFIHAVQQKGATPILSYPSLGSESFANMESQIDEIEEQLTQLGIPVAGTPERYIFTDNLLFNTPYHLTGEGAIIRTDRMIDDLKKLGVVD